MRQIVGLPLADGHQRLIRLVQRGDLDVAQTIRHAAGHIRTIRRGGQEPCGAIALGAKRDGATWFLAPRGNCDEVAGHVPSGLRDVAVSTIDDAYDAVVAIGKGKGASLPHCTVDTDVEKTK